MEIKQFLKNIEGALDGVNVDTLKPEMEFRKLEQWDSLAVLSTLAMVDAEYNTQIKADELRECKTFNDLFNLIKSKKG